MSLFDVKHQGRAQGLVQRAIARSRLPHALIFHGPSGVGKAMFARGLGEMLLCASSASRSVTGHDAAATGIDEGLVGCGECEDCRAVAADSHPDLHLVHRYLNRAHPDADVRKRKGVGLSIDVIRHFLINPSRRTAIRGRAKVFIVDEAESMSAQAQNALLKTLEEPPDKTFIILLVRAIDRLLETTLSRCQVLTFDALPEAFVEQKVRQSCADLSDEHATWYARCGDGSLGEALTQARDDLYTVNARLVEGLAALPADRRGADPQTWTDVAKALGEMHKKRDPDISDTEASRRGLRAVFRMAATWYGDILRVSAGHEASIVNTAMRADLAIAAGHIDAEQAGAAIRRIAEAEHHLSLNANTQLCLETMLNELARLGTSGVKSP